VLPGAIQPAPDAASAPIMQRHQLAGAAVAPGAFAASTAHLLGAASSAEHSAGHGSMQSSMQPMQSLAMLEDMLISPRFDSHSPHWRPFAQFAHTEQEQAGPDAQADVRSSRDQTRCKPRFSTSSLPDIDWQ
jgi:hypothetical protein